MKQRPFFICILFLCCVSLSPSWGAPSKPAKSFVLGVFPSSINVKNYGAKGDGVTDDTKAIQAAVNACVSQYGNWPVRVGHWNHLSKGILDNPYAEIVFPAGVYKISNTIVFSRYASLRGIGNAVIKQIDPAKDSFYFHDLLRTDVENLHFEGGKIQLRFWTDNNGTAQISVSHCMFSNSADYAIECRSYTKELLTGDTWNQSKPWSPYDVQWMDGTPRLSANNADHLVPWANSTLTNIAHCRFENVMHAVDLSGDTAVIRDCEITTNPQMEGPVFRLMGLIHLYRIKGLAKLGTGKDQYWIDTGADTFYTGLSLRDSVLDTDSKTGICVVHAAVLPVSTSIILENSRVQSAGCPEGAMLRIAKDTQPNIISINGMTEISGKPVKAVAWEQTPDAATLEALKDQPKGAASADIYKLQIAGNSPSVDDNTPAIFAPLLLQPVPASALKETFIPELPWNYDDLEKQASRAGKVILASAFGVDQNPNTDDTAAIQKMFDAAAKQGSSLVIFPAGVFTLSGTIQLSPTVVVRAAGVAAFVESDPQKDIFSARQAQTIAFKNCDFEGGFNGLNINSADNKTARIAFDNCAFYDQQKNGIQALAGKGQSGEPNKTQLWARGGIYATMHAVITNASHSQIDTFWAVNDPRLNEGAFFTNLGGEMRVQDLLGNPVLWQGKRGKAPANIKDWQFSKNTRWFDNEGKLYSLDNRFGGESGGMCNVVNRSADATVYIGGGLTRFYNGVTRNCILYLEKNPQLAVLQDISSVPAKIEDGFRVMRADGSDGGNNPRIIVRGVPTP